VLKSALLFGLFTCAGVVAHAETNAPPIAIHWIADRASPAVEVENVSRELLAALGSATEKTTEAGARVFAVFAEQPGEGVADRAMPPMSGRWRVEKDRLRFEPRFPFTPGVRYRAEFRLGGASPVISFFELPRESAVPETTVVQIFPSADVLPENQLKFYVQFSAPMSRGNAYEHIRVRDGAGRVIELPFLELDEELWDPTMTRLTLLIDPGRIKRGVKPLEDTGAVFEAGKKYAITVDTALQDATGRPLRAGFNKKFRAAAADRTPPDPTRWKIRPPVAGTRGALVVEFEEPMDQALALRLISVVAGERGRRPGTKLDGQTTLSQQERTWTFVPVQPWELGAYQLTVQTTIEDLAGNNIGKTFDVDVFEGIQRRIATESVHVEFAVR
jgi:hypothetical protein